MSFDAVDLAMAADDMNDEYIDDTDRYGSLSVYRCQPGAINTFTGIVQDYFSRKFSPPPTGDANCFLAVLLMPSYDDPDACMVWEQYRDQESYNAARNNPSTQQFIQQTSVHLAGPPTVVTGRMNYWQNKDVVGMKFGMISRFSVAPGKNDTFYELYNAHFDRQLDGKTEPNATVVNDLIVDGEPNTVWFFEQWDSQSDYQNHQNQPNFQNFLRQVPNFTTGSPQVKEGNMYYWQQKDLKSLDDREADKCCCSVM